MKQNKKKLIQTNGIKIDKWHQYLNWMMANQEEEKTKSMQLNATAQTHINIVAARLLRHKTN